MATSKKKTETIKFVSPLGEFRWPKISQPDTKGKYADGKFKTAHIPNGDDGHKRMVTMLEDAAKKLLGDNAKDCTMPIREFKNKDTGEVEEVGFNYKSKYRPAVFDAKKKKLPEGVTIGNGSEGRIVGVIFPWSKTTKVKGKNIEEHGISIRLGDVQITKLQEGGSQGTGADFDDDVEGYEYDGSADDADAERADQFDL
jgi:hypothetical protein